VNRSPRACPAGTSDLTVAAKPAEKVFEELRAFILKYAGQHLNPVIEPAIGQQPVQAADRPPL
jgi:hypothetical protein